MAEGWTRALRGDQIDPYSAGLEAHGLNPHAVFVMKEVGVDIRAQYSKTLDDLLDVRFDVVVTVCDDVHAVCPQWPHAPRVVHVGFDDPPRLAAQAKTPDEALAHYRRVRDEIYRYVKSLPKSLPEK